MHDNKDYYLYVKNWWVNMTSIITVFNVMQIIIVIIKVQCTRKGRRINDNNFATCFTIFRSVPINKRPSRVHRHHIDKYVEGWPDRREPGSGGWALHHRGDGHLPAGDEEWQLQLLEALPSTFGAGSECASEECKYLKCTLKIFIEVKTSLASDIFEMGQKWSKRSHYWIDGMTTKGNCCHTF